MSACSTAQLRKQLRLEFREKRKGLSASAQQQAAIKLVETWQQHGHFEPIKKVAIYLANDGELNTQELIDYFWSQQISVYLPVLHPFTKGYLLFLKYSPNTAMQVNKFGILEPCLDVNQVCPVNELDIIFTPLVAFDEQGNRLGMGGGFYDRTLQQFMSDSAPFTMRSTSRPALIGLAHDIQKTLSLPIETWDIPLPYILTPSQLFTFDRKST